VCNSVFGDLHDMMHHCSEGNHGHLAFFLPKAETITHLR